MRSEPFRIAVSGAVLSDLRERLARTRFPDEIAGSAWGYGSALAYMRELVAYRVMLDRAPGTLARMCSIGGWPRRL